MKTRHRNIIVNIIAVLLIIVLIGFSLLNIVQDSSNFFEFNFVQALTLLITIVLSIFLNKFYNSDEKIKQYILKLITSIQEIVEGEDFYCIDETMKDKFNITFTMRKKMINNKINNLEKFGKMYSIDRHIEYIKVQHEQYSMLISNHISNLKHLSNSKEDLMNYSQNISAKCDEIVTAIFI